MTLSRKRALTVSTVLSAALALVLSAPALGISAPAHAASPKWTSDSPRAEQKGLVIRLDVLSVLDGESVRARFPDKSVRTVHLLGIDAPDGQRGASPAECGADQAREYLRRVAVGDATRLVIPTTKLLPRNQATPVVGFLHRGRYDLGGALIRRGWAQADRAEVNPRRNAYLVGQAGALKGKRGVFGRCSGDFHSGTKKVPRIVNGVELDAARSAVFISTPSGACTGNALSPRWVLTARHCLDGVGAAQTVLVGAGSATIPPAPSARGDAIYLYPSPEVDVALLRVDTDLPITGPIGLVSASGSSSSDQFAGEDAFAVGWGALDPDATQFSPRLRGVALPVLSKAACGQIWPAFAPAYQLCAGDIAKWDSTCVGDSGGPLMVERGGNLLQIGITSGGSNLCGLKPSVFVDLSNGSIQSWISQTMSPPSSANAVPTGSDLVPCPQQMYQQATRAVDQGYLGSRPATRVISRLRIFDDPSGMCAKQLTFILLDKRTGKRIVQLPGSTLGYRTLSGKVFSAPVISWPTSSEFRFSTGDPTGQNRSNARLVLVSYLPRNATPSPSDLELRVVRAPGSGGLQADIFDQGEDWSTTVSS